MGVSKFLNKIKFNEYHLNISSIESNQKKSIKLLVVPKICRDFHGQNLRCAIQNHEFAKYLQLFIYRGS